jgi:hypothetical protein
MALGLSKDKTDSHYSYGGIISDFDLYFRTREKGYVHFFNEIFQERHQRNITPEEIDKFNKLRSNVIAWVTRNLKRVFEEGEMYGAPGYEKKMLQEITGKDDKKRKPKKTTEEIVNEVNINFNNVAKEKNDMAVVNPVNDNTDMTVDILDDDINSMNLTNKKKRNVRVLSEGIEIVDNEDNEDSVAKVVKKGRHEELAEMAYDIIKAFPDMVEKEQAVVFSWETKRNEVTNEAIGGNLYTTVVESKEIITNIFETYNAVDVVPMIGEEPVKNVLKALKEPYDKPEKIQDVVVAGIDPMEISEPPTLQISEPPTLQNSQPPTLEVSIPNNKRNKRT